MFSPKSLGPVSLDKWHVSLTYHKKPAFQTSNNHRSRLEKDASRKVLFTDVKNTPQILQPWKLKQESALNHLNSIWSVIFLDLPWFHDSNDRFGRIPLEIIGPIRSFSLIFSKLSMSQEESEESFIKLS